MTTATKDQIPSFGTLLRKHRLEAGLSQEALAERAGISANAVAALERGRRTRPRPDTVRLLVDALDLGEEIGLSLIGAALNPEQEPFSPPDMAAPTATNMKGVLGRDADLARLVESTSRHRLVSVLGPGGIGKTTLARALESVYEARGKDVAFVDLAAVHEPELLPSVLAEQLEVMSLDSGPLLESVANWLGERSFLLVLDNFEQIVAGRNVLSELLEVCPRLHLLVTSRIALRLRSEYRFEVSPLATPPHDDDDPASYPSVQLFLRRAESMHSSVFKDAPNLRAIAEICRRLDGLPLGIELAAARVGLLPPQALLDRLERRLAVLSQSSTDVPDRHRTLRATLDWSHDFLTSEEQQLFARLSVFDGGARIEGIEAVCGSDEDNMFAPLEALIDESLVIRTVDVSGEPRFGMLQTMLEYARERLVESGEAGDLWKSHAAYCVALSEEATAGLTGPEQNTWIQRLNAEMGNLRLALERCIDTNERELGLRLGIALRRFWFMSRHIGEGRRWLERLLVRFPKGSDDDMLRPAVLHAAASVAFVQTDYETSKRLGLEALQSFRRLEDDLGTADTLNTLANCYRNQGELREADNCYREAFAIYKRLNEQRGMAVTLNNMGTAAGMSRDFDRAAELQKEALTIRRQLGDAWGVANLLNNMADIALERGRPADAEAYCIESLAVRRELGDQNGVALALASLGAIALDTRKVDEAGFYHAESLALSLEVGNRGLARTNIEGLALIAARRGRPKEAIRLLGAVEAMVEDFHLGHTPTVEARFNQYVAEARLALEESHAAVGNEGAPSFDSIWSLGRTLSMERAASEAVEAAEPQAVVE